ncbi:MAG TPA: hypothetical protein VIC07_10305 [Acidimicrobiia bacterium]|jgi:hypothetical protein
MNGHPALAYTLALQRLDDRRHRSPSNREKAVSARGRTMKLGGYRITISREVPGVSRTV